MKVLNKFKKNKSQAQDDGLDIITEIKEPFSFSGFFETHIVERVKRIKNTLSERGVLFFLFSPFQARSRLIAQMFILCVGIAFGVIPRASSLVSALQDQAYASEIAGLTKKTVGSITITPAASSNYKKMHMLAFIIEGRDLPSDASKYEVHLARSYGASDWSDVTYSWTLYPVTDTERILLVAVDQSKQASGYGAFDLFIKLSGEEVSSYSKIPFEVTLSTAQETTDLYDKTGIHLSALTEAVCGTGDIAEKQAEFNNALEKYQVSLEQAEAMPVDLSVEPTKEELENYCLANRIYRTLDDYSTTEDILNIEEVNKIPEIDYGIVITSNGIKYDSDFITQLMQNGGYSDEDSIIFDAFEDVNEAKNTVINTMNSVNNAAMSWYSTLTSYKLILNQTIKFETFPLYARCTNTIDEDINFIDGTSEEPSDDVQSGITSTTTGDEPYVKPEPSGTDEPVINPPVEDEPVIEEPIEDEPIEDEPIEESSEKPDNVNTKYVGNSSQTSTGDPADSK